MTPSTLRGHLVAGSMVFAATVVACGGTPTPLPRETAPPPHAPAAPVQLYVTGVADIDADGDCRITTSRYAMGSHDDRADAFPKALVAGLRSKGITAEVGVAGPDSLSLKLRVESHHQFGGKKYSPDDYFSVSVSARGTELRSFKIPSYDSSCAEAMRMATGELAQDIADWFASREKPGSAAVEAHKCWQQESALSPDTPRRVHPFWETRSVDGSTLLVKVRREGGLDCANWSMVLGTQTAAGDKGTRKIVFSNYPGWYEGSFTKYCTGWSPEPFKTLFPGVQVGDVLTEINHEKVSKISADMFDVSLPPGTASIPLTVERPRTDGFVGYTTHELRIPLPQRPHWQLLRSAMGHVEGKSLYTPMPIGIADLGARGKPELLYLAGHDVSALDLATGCSRRLDRLPSDNDGLAVFRRLAPNYFVLLVKVNEGYDGSWSVTRLFPEKVDGAFGERKWLPKNRALWPSVFQAECLIDLDKDGIADFVEVLGANIHENRLDFDHVQGVIGWSYATGEVIYNKGFDRTSIQGAPGYAALAAANFSASKISSAQTVKFDVTGTSESEAVSVAEDGFLISSTTKGQPDTFVRYESIDNFPKSPAGTMSITAADLANNGMVNLVALRWNCTGNGCFVQALDIGTGQKRPVDWALAQGTPDGRTDEVSRRSYASDPSRYMANMGASAKP